jgi:carbon monoxide dehydrogenase subunit G
MRLDDSFEVQAPIDEVYATILDVRRVTGCVPGAELISTDGDVSTVGITVKVGPIAMRYRGEVEIVERDPDGHRAVMKVRASEVRGQGTANATAELKLREEGGKTVGDVGVDVALSGRVASMGQGAIQDVSSKLVARFARNLTRLLSGPDAGATGNGAGGAAAPVEDSISGAEVVGAVVAGRLRNPWVAGGIAATVLAFIGVFIGLRARRD